MLKKNIGCSAEARYPPVAPACKYCQAKRKKNRFQTHRRQDAWRLRASRIVGIEHDTVESFFGFCLLLSAGFIGGAEGPAEAGPPPRII
jgi:hypothetical protein